MHEPVAGDERRAIARTLAHVAAVADLLGDRLRAAEEAAGGDPATTTRLLVARLLRRRPEDEGLLDLVWWLATTHDLPAALAAGGWRPDPAYPGGWRPPARPAGW